MVQLSQSYTPGKSAGLQKKYGLVSSLGPYVPLEERQLQQRSSSSFSLRVTPIYASNARAKTLHGAAYWPAQRSRDPSRPILAADNSNNQRPHPGPDIRAYSAAREKLVKRDCGSRSWLEAIRGTADRRLVQHSRTPSTPCASESGIGKLNAILGQPEKYRRGTGVSIMPIIRLNMGGVTCDEGLTGLCAKDFPNRGWWSGLVIARLLQHASRGRNSLAFI